MFMGLNTTDSQNGTQKEQESTRINSQDTLWGRTQSDIALAQSLHILYIPSDRR